VTEDVRYRTSQSGDLAGCVSSTPEEIPVRDVATQRAGLRGIGFELGLLANYLVVAPVVSRTAGGGGCGSAAGC
jgi:hypothetical protein